MKSLTGKFPSVRGWALLLALLLGAGMMISACGDEEVPTPTTPEPPPTTLPPPPPEPDPEPEPTGPATPGNLRVASVGANYIEWAWDAVEEVLGYQGQFSPDASFTDTDPTFLIVAPQTSHRVENLQGSMTGYFRVRSGAGTSLTDLEYSDWSDGVSGTTSAPPAAVPLDAPGNFESSDPENDSIVLTWDDVDNAETYEVEQRADGASSWSAATCGDGGNEVEDTTCIASDLDEGTDYEFRVRGVPAADDTAYTAGAWAETEGATTGAAAVVTPGGAGDLNVTWTADDDGITFSWAPMAGASYEWIELGIDRRDAPDPCADLDWKNATTGATFEHTTGANARDVKGICVRTDDPDNRATSFAWGLGKPGGATPGTTSHDGNVTTALTWNALHIVENFSYEIRVVGDPERDNDIGEDTPNRAIQAACSAGAFVDQGDADVSFPLDEVTVSSGLSPYTGYLLCFRQANTAGATEWAVPRGVVELNSRPGQPPTPTLDSSRTNTTETKESVVWRIATRNEATVPRTHGGDKGDNYIAWLVVYDETYLRKEDPSTDSRNTRTSTPRVADCAERGQPEGEEWKWALVTDMSTDNEGIVIRSGDIDRNDPAEDFEDLERHEDNDPGDKQVALCVQALGADGPDGGEGPWVMSSTHEVRRQPDEN